jgi:hypothetical protein
MAVDPDEPAELELTAHAAAGVRLIEQARELGLEHHAAAVELALLGDTPTVAADDPAVTVDQAPGPWPEWALTEAEERELDADLEEAHGG